MGFPSTIKPQTNVRVPRVIKSTERFATVTVKLSTGSTLPSHLSTSSAHLSAGVTKTKPGVSLFGNHHLAKYSQRDVSPLRLLDHAIQSARSANNTPAEQARLYKEASGILEQDELYNNIENGPVLYVEAALGSAIQLSQHEILSTLKRLYRASGFLATDADSSTVLSTNIQTIQAELMKSYLLAKYASYVTQQQLPILARAEKILSEAVEKLDTQTIPSAEKLRYSADILSIELAAKRLEIEHLRGNRTGKRASIEKLLQLSRLLAANYSDDNENKATTAAYLLDVAMLFARLQLWGRALEVGRKITENQILSTTEQSKRLLTSDTFEHFVDKDKTRILSPQEIKNSSSFGLPWVKKLEAAVYAAHSESITQSMSAGAMGVVAGFAGELLITGGVSLYGGIGGAALLTSLNRLRNGLTSEEAQSAFETGLFERSVGEQALDIGGLLLKGAGDAVAWSLPSTLVYNGVDVASIIQQTFAIASQKYAAFANWGVNGVLSLFDPQTYAEAIDSFRTSSDVPLLQRAAQGVLSGYAASAGLYYFANLLVPSLQPKTKKWAPLFIPGAIALSADIGIEIAGIKEGSSYWADFADRAERAGIVFGEIYFAMFTAGLASLAAKKNFKEGLQSLGKGIRTTNYVMPLGAAIITGISSPLGGMVKANIPIDDPFLFLVQGSATTFCLLPITLGFSGLLKGTIPLFEGVAEGWQDTKGMNPIRRVAETILTAASEFHMPYTHNRTFRIFQHDAVPSGVRSWIGWDTNTGQAAMSVINNFYGNHASTMTWTEPSGTMWERDALAKRLSDAHADISKTQEKLKAGEISLAQAENDIYKALGLPHDLLVKSGQNLHPLHMLLPNDIFGRLYPLVSFIRAAVPPKFPTRPNVFTFANLYQMLCGDSMNYKLTGEQVGTMLQYVEAYANDPNEHIVLKPLVHTLALARDSLAHGEQIKKFFDENPWIAQAFDVDFEKLTIERSRFRRKNRAGVRKAIKMPLKEYEADMRLYETQKGWQTHLKIIRWFKGIFTKLFGRKPQIQSVPQNVSR